ncbi:LysR family transcriptional regulator, hydrogen peroxide-inducible genes activator [Pedobacter steynii]|jgi:LysR family hydrogen peroxide-inducible transcriptional activator|uniref:LysR family transcriptional regulator, hydrogen peroxide-inducible genes activator n=1 Tax=Pedobacter steynii TaxID=430522 RepID=A0A1H0DSJ3_9SPHI|nr:hydrogen peroxide-inducible genes activator [Pedobacter steynii]NQX41825.1 hydrogen peroxide-inducible genes activator [Pedobacter steynii]SDN73132.1 LysR family transcriptional regulator, hydrogen peroxide-inducible genes activator [Pedobacter steynii]
MTLVQLEYIVAVDTYRSFVGAAEKCFVTQPTLSMQVQKLEEMLNVKIFDRSKQPVIPTEIGAQVIEQARMVLQESQKIKEIISSQQQDVVGELKVGIIPTVAPYLLPRVISGMMEKFPDLKLLIWEYTTEDIIHHLKTGVLDCGILATPLADNNITELPLYYENFVTYISKNSKLFKKKTIDANDLEDENIWLLNEGHCMRSQVLNICRSTKDNRLQGLTYNTGSVETLIRMVDVNNGATLLPELALAELTNKQLSKVRYFRSPEPVREISLITHKNFIKKRMLNALKEEILAIIPKTMKQKKRKDVVGL